MKLTTTIALFLVAGPVWAQSSGPAARLRGETESLNTRKRLAEAQQKLQTGKATEAADELQRISDESGDDLVAVQANHFQPARRLVQQLLAALPPQTLIAFQNRLEEPAKKLLDAGRRDRDPAPLRHLLNRYFVSRPAENAIVLLGELLFERGDFRAAEQTWRLLLPTGDPRELAYPNPQIDPASVGAKLVLAAIFAGDLDRAKVDLAGFAKEHPKAAGRLAGTDGLFAEILAKLLANPPAPRDSRGTEGWTTFAGNPSRDGALAEPLPRLVGRPTWTTPMPRQFGDKFAYRPASFPAAKTLAFHPVVLGGTAFLAEAGRIFSFDLQTGAGRVAFDARTLGEALSFSEAETALPNLLDTDFTLTAHGGRLYARMGNVELPSAAEPPTGKLPGSFLVVLESAKNLRTLKAIATLAPPVGKPGKVAWEGAPLVADGKLFAACTRVDDRGRWIHAIACYDDPPGAKPNWVVDVADTDAATPRSRHEVLTLAGGNVVFALPQGMVLAVDRSTGRMAWAFRAAPAVIAPQNGPQQDLCPAVYSGGRIFFAPASGDKLHALDSETGRPLWDEGPLQVGQILGVSRNRVIVTVLGPQKGIRAYDVAGGSDREPRGWRNHDDRHLATYGRGLLTPDAVLFPTQEKLYTLSLVDGSVRGLPMAGPHGNLAYANGVLLVATPTALSAYVLDPKESAEPARPPLVPADTVPPFQLRARIALTAEPWEWPRAELALGGARELAPGAWPLELMEADPKVILQCDGTAVWSSPTGAGPSNWKAVLKTPARLVRAAFDDGYWIAWGVSTVASIKASDGSVRWQFDSPSPEAALAGGSLVGSRFIVCLGTRCLLALDSATGRVAWLRDPLGRPRFREFAIASSPEFNPLWVAIGDVLLIQKSDGERWTLSADTGRVLHAAPTSLTPWTTAPAVTADGLAIVPDGAGTLVALEPRGNRTLWRYEAGGESGLAGAAPEVVCLDARVFALFKRNTGAELIALDAITGEAAWKMAVRLPDPAATLAGLTADRERLYLPGPGGVVGCARRDGGRAWRCDWPSEGIWQTVATSRGLLACRTAPLPEEPLAEVLVRAARRLAEWPSPIRFAGLCTTLFRTLFTGTATVVLFDPETGRVAGRVDAPALGPFAKIQKSVFSALLLTTGRTTELNAGK